jgi:uncharacterized membrane protein
MSIYNLNAGRRVNRIEAISDGVFVVAFTLLVLDLKVPVAEGIHNEHDLMTAFSRLTPKLLIYFLGFMTLGIFWSGQAVPFTFIEKSNRHLNWISLFFLIFVSILPFRTAFLSEYIHFKFAIFIYWLNAFLLGVIIYFNWPYAYTQDFLSVTGEEKINVDKAILKRVITAQSLYFNGLLLCFLNTYLSIAFIILVQLNYALALFSKTKQV